MSLFLSLFSRLSGYFAEILDEIRDRFHTDNGMIHLRDVGQTMLLREWSLYDIGGTRELCEGDPKGVPKWLMPMQYPVSAESIFIGHFRSKTPNRIFRKTTESMTIDDVWSGLSRRERNYFTAKAKKNEVCNRVLVHPSQSFLDLDLNSTERKTPWLRGLQSWYRYRSDHPKACGGRKTPVPEAPFRIMNLTFELRREAFLLVLSQSRPVLQFPSDGSANVPQGPIDVRLFAVSKQVFAEAVKVFYEMNAFSMSTDGYWYFKGPPLFVRQSSGIEAPRPTDLIKRVRVRLDFGSSPTSLDEILFLWRIFCKWLVTCKSLREVKVTLRWRLPKGDHATEVVDDLRIGKVAEIFKNLISANGVQFSEVVSYEAARVWRTGWGMRRITGIMI